MADEELLRYAALKTGLGLKYLSKDEKVSLALEQLRPLFPDAIFKGGTALNRVYLAKNGVSRFSEDIDLDYISHGSLDEMIARIKTGIYGLNGFNISGPRIMHRTIRFDCGYMNEFGERDQIKIEFYLNNVKSLRTEDVLVKSPFIEAHTTLFKTYSLEDLIAKKLIALHNRTEGKDIYDLFYSLDLDYSWDKLNLALDLAREHYKVEKEGFYDRLAQKLQDAKKNSFYVGNSTNHFIPARLRPDWKIFIATLGQKIERMSDENTSHEG
ncbi:nucleotidyl transferase AbiEii/AbiGii toxin family protein [Methanocella arvoryzae]|uniref:Nucleotidyl transferase AbiEii/AbiGii toxin family protein n=1 Tax=Methanocella arvoryzae (strain DSM 22066 / NBRC 105507 / MRE50) TaxID=351160 RepID=Q0W4I1_METAR|nr:nucleotidyl transferase AbiEii/AbiGii toxin family protein [Methanocella arvoryzae]CAJ36712.1 conserved hypothetical protein [Methanocella arvoryzae MRE50]